MSKKLLKSLVCFILTGMTSFTLAQTPEAVQVLTKAGGSSVVVIAYGEGKAEIARGAGLFLASDIVATAYHLVSKAVEVETVNQKGKKGKAEGILAVDRSVDLALLRVKNKGDAVQAGGPEGLAEGARIFAVGGNEMGQIIVSEGTIGRFLPISEAQKAMELSLAIPEQFCGSGLFDVDGRAVGMVLVLERGLKVGLPFSIIKALAPGAKVTDFKAWTHEDYFNLLEGALFEGRLATQKDDQMTARMSLEKVVKLNPSLREAQEMLASVYLKQRDYSSAASAFKKTVELDPSRSEAWFGLGTVYSKMQNWKEAIAAYEKAISLGTKSKEVFLELGQVNEEIRDFAKAGEAYEKYLALKPENTGNGYLRLGLCRMETGQYDAAIQAFQESLKTQDKDLKTNYSLAEAYQKAGMLDQAEAQFKKLAEINSRDAKTYYSQILKMYDEKNMYDKAVEAARKIIELDPSSEMPVYNLGIMLLKLERYDEAIEAFRQSLALKADNTWAWYNIGLSYARQKKHKESIEAFRKVVELAPDNADGWFNIGIESMMLKDFEGALEPLKKCLELRPDHAYALYNQGIVYLNLKDNYSAREVYKTLQGIDPALAEKLKKLLR